MCIDYELLAVLHSRLEDARAAAVLSDERVANARAAFRDASAGYRALREQLLDAGLRELAERVMGAPLERAAVVLGEPGA